MCICFFFFNPAGENVVRLLVMAGRMTRDIIVNSVIMQCVVVQRGYVCSVTMCCG